MCSFSTVFHPLLDFCRRLISTFHFVLMYFLPSTALSLIFCFRGLQRSEGAWCLVAFTYRLLDCSLVPVFSWMWQL